ncbi:hypothetical protein EVAR_68516_1 [Eumeta japonica]|uniref:Uncharacterized protein n=1 Tax=Eumeta variegata TaxID=151549 RepID=A0A4C1ZGI3_EUMVA|nr:hypothetical protein EVAR_68516_1 [Eumeta japonica]
MTPRCSGTVNAFCEHTTRAPAATERVTCRSGYGFDRAKRKLIFHTTLYAIGVEQETRRTRFAIIGEKKRFDRSVAWCRARPRGCATRRGPFARRRNATETDTHLTLAV